MLSTHLSGERRLSKTDVLTGTQSSLKAIRYLHKFTLKYLQSIISIITSQHICLSFFLEKRKKKKRLLFNYSSNAKYSPNLSILLIFCHCFCHCSTILLIQLRFYINCHKFSFNNIVAYKRYMDSIV